MPNDVVAQGVRVSGVEQSTQFDQSGVASAVAVAPAAPAAADPAVDPAAVVAESQIPAADIPAADIPAGNTPAADAATTGPVVTVPSPQNLQAFMESLTSDQRQVIMQMGGQIPQEFFQAAAAPAPAPEPATVEQPADPVQVPAAPAEEPAAPEPETATAEAAPAVDYAAELAAFKFTEGADPETRAAEEARYLELVELTPQIEQMISARDTELSALREQVASLPAGSETAQKYVSVFDEMIVEEVFNEDIGRSVPKTESLRNLLRSDDLGPRYREQVIRDLNNEPSEKYPNLTMYQEFMRDGFGLDDEGLANVQAVLDNGGRPVIPRFTPEGIHESVAEAYWTAYDRDDIESRVKDLVYVIYDESANDTEKTRAKNELQAVNNRLGQIQAGLNATREGANRIEQQKQQAIATVQENATTSFVTRTVGIRNNFSETLKTRLAPALGPGAGIAATAIAATVVEALSDDDDYAKAAQADLKREGIAFGKWTQGRELVNRLRQQELVLAAQQYSGAHKRAIEKTQGSIADILRELKPLEKELEGQITTALVGGAGAQLKQTVAAAPKVPAARPRVPSTPSYAAAKLDWDSMSPEERQSRMGELRAEALKQGIILPN